MNNDDISFYQQQHHSMPSMLPNPTPNEDDTPSLLAEPRKVGMAAGSRWLLHAWIIFKARWAMCLGMAFVMGLITSVLGEIPYVGWLSGLLNLLFVGGLMLSCDALVEGDELEFEYLFSGFKFKLKELLICSVIMFGLVLLLLTVLILLILMGSSMDSDTLFNMFNIPDSINARDVLVLLIFFLLFMVLLLPVMMMTWFAPALICLHDIKAWDAMKMSLQACLRNVMPFLVYSLVMFAVMFGMGLLISGIVVGAIALTNEIIGMILALLFFIPLGLAWTIIWIISYYTSYRSIWTTPTLEE